MNRNDIVQIRDLTSLQKGDRIFLQENLTDETAPLIAGRFISLRMKASKPVGLVISLPGTSVGVPFEAKDWIVFVPKSYPLPAQEDVETIIYNAIQRGIEGNPSSYSEVARTIMGLIKGEISTPIEVVEAQPRNPEPGQMPEYNGPFDAA